MAKIGRLNLREHITTVRCRNFYPIPDSRFTCFHAFGLAIHVTLHLFSSIPVTENAHPSYFPLMYDRSGEIDRSGLSIMIDLPTFMNWKPYCDVGLVVRGRPALFVFTLLMGAKFVQISLRSKFRVKIIRLKIRHLNNFT